MLINVQIQIIVGIITFISRMNITSESWKVRKKITFYHFTSN